MFGVRLSNSLGVHCSQAGRLSIQRGGNRGARPQRRDEPGQRFGELARESHEIYGTALGATTLQIGQTSPSEPRLRYPLDRRLK